MSYPTQAPTVASLFACPTCKACCASCVKEIPSSFLPSPDERLDYKIPECKSCKREWLVCLLCNSRISVKVSRTYIKGHHLGVRHQERLESRTQERLPGQHRLPNESIEGSVGGATNGTAAQGCVDPIDQDGLTDSFPDRDDDDDTRQLPFSQQEIRSCLSKRKYPETFVNALITQPEATPREIMKTLAGHIHGSPYYFVRNSGVRDGSAIQDVVGCGPQALVGAAFTGQALSRQTKIARIEDTSYQLGFTEHVSLLSGSQVARLLKLNSALDGGELKREPLRQGQDPRLYVEANVLRCPKMVDAKLLSGKVSVMNQVPSPLVLECCGNAYIPYESIIKYTMAIGIPVGSVVLAPSEAYDRCIVGDDPVSSLQGSQRLQDLLATINSKRLGCTQGYTVVIPYCLWQDGFDPSGVKRNKGSIWMKTMTLLPPPGDKDSSIRTFPIALASKAEGRDIDELERRLAEGFESIASRGVSVWDPQTNRILDVSIAHMFNLQDRPERGSSLALLGHAGICAKRFGHICRLDTSNFRLLPSCPTCRNRTRQLIEEPVLPALVDSACMRCANWSYYTEAAVSLLSSAPIAKYPKTGYSCDWAKPPQERSLPCPPTVIVPSEQEITNETVEQASSVKLAPAKLTYDFLKSASTFAYSNLVHDHWNIGETRAYANNAGLNDERESNIIELAKRRREAKDLSKPEDSELFIPAWNAAHCDVEHHVETPMHLLFLGISSALIDLLERSLKFMDGRARVPCLDGIGKALSGVRKQSLEWAKALPFSAGKKYSRGPWVSENYLGYARIAKYAMIFVPKPEKPDEMRKEMEVYLSVVSTAVSLSGMLCRLMSRTVTPRHADETQLWIAEFLSCVNELDSFLGWKDQRPLWFSKSNFLGLLNLPDMMRLYGPVREMWEGGAKGEGFIGEIKSHIYGVREGRYWLRNMLQKIVKARSLKLMLEKLETVAPETNDNDKASGSINVVLEDENEAVVDEGATEESVGGDPLTWKFDRYKGVRIMSSRSELEDALVAANNKTISAIRCGDGRVLIPFYMGHKAPDRQKAVSTMTVVFDDGHLSARMLCGCWFAPINVLENEMVGAPATRTELYEQARGFVLLLPNVVNEVLVFYAVDDSWFERNELGRFVQPSLLNTGNTV